MNTTRILSIVLTFVLVILSLVGCQSEKSNQEDDLSQSEIATSTEKSNMYRLEEYENSEVFNIAVVDQKEEYDKYCTTYKFTYLSDGFKVNGYISIPLSIVNTQKPGKCVMYNHGGNRDYGSLRKNTTALICSVCDRIVVASKYRGCGGSEGKDQFGGDDLRDVIKLIDICDKYFSFVDMDDFCIIGASRGGVMTYPAARQDKRIKRIIALSAITDLFETYENGDEQMRNVLIETVGCTPQENPSEYEKRSAVCWADEINVPVLMFHSKKDPRVSYKEAEELYTKLKDVTDCTLITYDDDSHSEVHPEDYKTIRNWLNQ